MRQNKYERFNRIQKLMSMTLNEKENCSERLKIVQTGQFELCDYGRGFLAVSIYVTPHYVRENIKFDNQYQVRLHFSNIDDGDAGARSKLMSLKEASVLAERVSDDIFKDMITLPTMIELNKLLREYGLYVISE